MRKVVGRWEKNGRRSKFGSKKRAILFCGVAVIAALLAVAILFWHDISDHGFGVVTSISARMKSDDRIEIKLKYILPTGGYSVCAVSEREGEYVGDGMTDYDGSLGKYRIMITFGDVDLSDSIVKKMASDGYLELLDGPITVRAKVVFPADHGFVLYIGSDTPIHVENSEDGKLDWFAGSIRIPITADVA